MRSLVFCETCKFAPDQKTGADGRTGGETLISHMREILAEGDRQDIHIQTQVCLWNCKRHCSVVLRDEDKFTYFTGDHAPTRAQAEAILKWFDLHGESETGEVSFKLWPDEMRGHFIARIPATKS
jgi:predicted metal-binding protein